MKGISQRWRECIFLSATLLVLGACSKVLRNPGTAVDPVSVTQNLRDGGSQARDSISLVYQGDPNQVTLADAAFAYAQFILPDNPRNIVRRSNGNLLVSASGIVRDFGSAVNFLTGDLEATEPRSLVTILSVDYAPPENVVDLNDVAILMSAFQTPLAERNSSNLVSGANILLGEEGLASNELAPLASTLSANPPVLSTDSGLIYRDWIIGTGNAPQARATRVFVDYIGRLNDENGTVFDSSYSRNYEIEEGDTSEDVLEKRTFSFCPGFGRVIDAWDETILTMRVGGRRTIVVPPELGYGSTGTPNGSIPPNATIYFEMILRRVKPLATVEDLRSC